MKHPISDFDSKEDALNFIKNNKPNMSGQRAVVELDLGSDGSVQHTGKIVHVEGI